MTSLGRLGRPWLFGPLWVPSARWGASLWALCSAPPAWCLTSKPQGASHAALRSEIHAHQTNARCSYWPNILDRQIRLRSTTQPLDTQLIPYSSYIHQCNPRPKHTLNSILTHLCPAGVAGIAHFRDATRGLLAAATEVQKCHVIPTTLLKKLPRLSHLPKANPPIDLFGYSPNGISTQEVPCNSLGVPPI